MTKGGLVSLIVLAGILLVVFIFFKVQKDQAEKEVQMKEIKRQEQILNNASPEQIAFERQRAQYYSDYLTAQNDITKSKIFNDANNYSRQFAERKNFRFNNWFGTLKTIYTGQGGNDLFFEVTSKLSDMTISYKVNYEISQQSTTYNQIAELKEGDKVFFDFEFIPDIKRGVVEASFSEDGSLRAPEFNVFFHNIRAK